MWPIPALDNELVTITLSPETLTCCWLKKSHNQPITHIQAYQRHTLHNNELEKLILFNPTYIKKCITDFLSCYNIQNAFIALSLTGQHISEEYMTFAVSTPKREDFGITNTSSFIWGYHYLYQNEKGQFVFYVYKIPQFILLQYKLLTVAIRLNIITMTTKNFALFHCYKNIHATDFRQTQFAIDMEKHHNNPELLADVHALQRRVIIPSNISMQEELIFLATHYGLFINQGLLS